MPERATRPGELWAHYAASGHAIVAVPGTEDWADRISGIDIGPCSVCAGPTIRYGAGGGPLCLDCRGPA